MSTAVTVALGRETFDIAYANEQVSAAWHVLGRCGIELVGDHEVATTPEQLDAIVERASATAAELIIVLQATFADARTVIEMSDRTDVPLLIWSFPEARSGGRLRLNSLCGANLAAFSLRQRRHPAVFVHVAPEERDAADRLRASIADALSMTAEPVLDVPATTRLAATNRRQDVSTRAVDCASGLRGSRIGVIGEPPDGFEPCRADQALRDRIEYGLGVRIERVQLPELFAAADRADDRSVRAATDRASSTVAIPVSVAKQGLDESMHLYCGLRSICRQHDWSAVSTRCWPECMTEYGGAVCTPQAMLTEDGIPAACEADALGAVTALMLRRVADVDPFVVDLVDIDPHDDTSVVWHCGSASPNLAADIGERRGIVHPNRHRALVNEFPLAAGRVTLARLSQIGGTVVMVVAGATMLDRPRPFTGTCGTMRWDLPVGDVIRSVFDVGLEHHLGLAYGDHCDTLVDLARLWELPILRLGHSEFET